MVGEHVREPHQSGLALAVLGVVALDDARHRTGESPAASQDPADERVVDAELASLALDPFLRSSRPAVDLARIAWIRLDENELANVMHERGDHQPIRVVVADLLGQTVGSPLRGHRVQPEALGNALPHGRVLEEVKRPGAAGDRVDGLGREHLDPLYDAVHAPVQRPLHSVREPHHGDRQRDVGLHRGHDLAGRHDA